MLEHDDAFVCANCETLNDWPERYLLTADGWTCSLSCHLEYFELTEAEEDVQ